MFARGVAISMICVGALPLTIIAGQGNASIDGSGKADFGKYPANERKTADFKVENKGSGALKITGIQKTCGCAEAVSDITEIPPGGKARISAVMLEESISGPYSKNIYVLTDDKLNSMLCLTLSGNAIPLFEIKPQNAVYAGRIMPGATFKQSFSIEPVGGAFSLGKPKAECPGAKAACELSRTDRGAWNLTVSLTPEKASGDLVCKVSIPLEGIKGWKDPELSICGKAGCEIVTVPSKIKFDTAAVKSVQVRMLGFQEAPTPESISMKVPDGVSCKLLKTQGGLSLEVKASPEFISKLGGGGGSFCIELSHPLAPTAKLTLEPVRSGGAAAP